jgi:hypothetical protein
MATNNNLLYNWKYEDTKHRSPIWYVIALSIAIWLIIWWFLTRQYGMSIVIMLVVWFFYFLENNSEDEVAIELTELGIKVQGNFYDYSRIWWYSIVYHWEQAIYLRLLIKKRGIWILNLNIDNRIAADIRSILPNYIEENEKQEITLSEKIIQLLKL